MPDLDAWTAALEDDRNRDLSWGWQAFVSVGDEVVVDEARGVDGVLRPLDATSLHRIYCSGRPFTAVALAVLVEEGRLEFETCLGDVLDEVAKTDIGKLSLIDVLTNRSGLHEVSAAPFSLMQPLERVRFVTTLEPRQAPGGVATYDEYAGWLLLGMVIERVTGRRWRDHVRTSVLEPLDLTDDVFPGFDADDWSAQRRRIAVNVDLMRTPPIPLLADATAMVAQQCEPNIGVYATMRGLGRFYMSLLASARPDGDGLLEHATLSTMLSTRSVHGWDSELERNCAYGLGFMVGLTDHAFGTRIGPRAFGQTGFRDFSSFCDPDADLTMAIHFTGFVDPGRPEAIEREHRIDDLYDALDV